ncbi:PREDICTED: complement C1r subcomponent-like protein isoform X3 [Hipposideros armiger]|uniref:Complement C1r subcomponent-like protein n=1 Tax=Hipposideros armiger TaxID=186990 RepID=A0A8B7Q367_HIPAR|nr:PREDICTED: complement C1r subcomponent-like protein isoform X3 [Hipposideros armiger]
MPDLRAGNYLWGSPYSTSCPGKMWWLLLWGVLQACPTQGSVRLAQQLPQHLTSPGYPEPYLKGQESTTVIEAPQGFAVKLVFQDFDLEPSQDCERDSVTITASGMDPSRFCGQQDSPLGSPPGQREFVSSGGSLQLTFYAPASSEDKTTHLYKGFLALYQAVTRLMGTLRPHTHLETTPTRSRTTAKSPIIRQCLQRHSPAQPKAPGKRHRTGKRFLTVYLCVDGQSPPSPRTRKPKVLPKLSWATSPGKPSPLSMAVQEGLC